MANNKLREALTKILNLTNSLDENCAVDPVEIRDIAKAALSEPVRNCDVGTADEQFERFGPFCNRYDDDCTGCPCDTDSSWNFTNCFARWAQMPYEEGGDK